ncbi:hypothetical protein [Glaciecola sp. SC05]|uniref:hypothetical protein n=1 Tax=Glaciecola sp. SC05 TaxID=1987355 RepID=UPI0035299C84
MQTTDYFAKKLNQPEYQHIQAQWIISTYTSPEFKFKQSDGRFGLYRKITEMNNQYLKLVLLKDGKTVRDVYFDKKFNPRAAARLSKMAPY